MSTIIIKFICSVLMAFSGLIVVKNISGSKEKIISIKNILLICILIFVPVINYGAKYTYISTLTVFIVSIFVYKYILKISFSKSTICCSILYLSLFILEFISSQIFVYLMSLDEVRNILVVNILFNLVYSIFLLLIFNIKFVYKNIRKFISKIEHRKGYNYIVFFVLLIMAMSIILYTVAINYKVDNMFYVSFLLPLLFFSLIIILVNEEYNYNKLYTEYDNLFTYVKVFEDWIENEQLIRHEYKNQLAVLRCMTKEKKVKYKIDSIISETINIDDNMVNQLKNLPNGGFKGLLYYKIIVAKNNNIKLEINIGNEYNEVLNKLSDDKLKVLSNIIGIYLDNAIEASKETKRKIVSIEIYEYDSTANIIISNTFNTKLDISKRNEKGYSTKGTGRGNGLYFANKLLTKNSWICEQQDIIDGFYIERIRIKNSL
ncbi:MAG: GHKL domain-containing protein [bacterium]|nr:GHKL domain-containing protein [bacterium]